MANPYESQSSSGGTSVGDRASSYPSFGDNAVAFPLLAWVCTMAAWGLLLLALRKSDTQAGPNFHIEVDLVAAVGCLVASATGTVVQCVWVYRRRFKRHLIFAILYSLLVLPIHAFPVVAFTPTVVQIYSHENSGRP